MSGDSRRTVPSMFNTAEGGRAGRVIMKNYGIKILSSTLHLLSVYIKMRTFKTHVLFVDSNCLIKFVLHSIFLVGTRVVLPNLKANDFRQALY